MAFHLETPDQLLARITAHCAEHGVALSTFGQRYFKNPHLCSRLGEGHFVRPKTYVRINEIIGQPESEAA